MGWFKTLLKNLGPGLLFASMSIGTSHLVLSTKAGAQYGWLMIVPIILANLLKYPFFEFGIRYTVVTRKSLIEGYKILGKHYLWIYAFITLASTFTILAALYIVTSGLLVNMFNIENVNINLIALALFGFISAILIIGRYRFLELSLKFVVSILFIALLITTVLVLVKGPMEPMPNFETPSFFDDVGVLFIIGLVGWMPTAVEASGWVSLWSVEKMKTTGTFVKLKDALHEFNVGYIITALLAIFFLIIGLMTLYGTGTELSGNATVFADQVITLFTQHIGNWAYSIIAIAAFATMFSTCMTAHDAISRVSLDVLDKLAPSKKIFKSKGSFALMVLFMALVNWIVILSFSGHMGNLVALATFISFVFAPFIGWMNLKAVTSKEIRPEYHPKKGLTFLTYLGMFFLLLFSIYYLWMVLF